MQKAFDQAKALLLLESIPEEDTPVLYLKSGKSADNITLVNPK